MCVCVCSYLCLNVRVYALVRVYIYVCVCGFAYTARMLYRMSSRRPCPVKLHDVQVSNYLLLCFTPVEHSHKHAVASCDAALPFMSSMPRVLLANSRRPWRFPLQPRETCSLGVSWYEV